MGAVRTGAMSRAKPTGGSRQQVCVLGSSRTCLCSHGYLMFLMFLIFYTDFSSNFDAVKKTLCIIFLCGFRVAMVTQWGHYQQQQQQQPRVVHIHKSDSRAQPLCCVVTVNMLTFFLLFPYGL